MCETVRCLGETGFSSSANMAVFPQVLPSACQVMMRSVYRIQLIFDLRRRIAFQKQIFNDSSTLDFVLNSLKRLLHYTCASKMAETLGSN